MSRPSLVASLRSSLFFGAFLAASGALAAAAQAASPVPAVLEFAGAPGAASTVLALADLRKACGERVVEVDDPYHGRRMRYRALAFRCVLDQGFAARGGAASLAGRNVVLTARDGYARSADGGLLGDERAFLAFGEQEGEQEGEGAGASGKEAPPRFSPIDRRRVDPAPFYLVWTNVARGDPHEHPWPYQLVRVEVVAFETAYPHTVPRGLAKVDPGWQGYALFQSTCSACHAINGEGGKVGPELNVPRSIVEYRPIEEIRAYVRNPQATRYTSMPAHPHLTDRDLDGLIAYFVAMSRRKHDPGARGNGS